VDQVRTRQVDCDLTVLQMLQGGPVVLLGRAAGGEQRPGTGLHAKRPRGPRGGGPLLEYLQGVAEFGAAAAYAGLDELEEGESRELQIVMLTALSSGGERKVVAAESVVEDARHVLRQAHDAALAVGLGVAQTRFDESGRQRLVSAPGREHQRRVAQ